MEYLVLENDEKLTDSFSRYLHGTSATTLYRADKQSMEVLKNHLSKNDVLGFQPTQITYSQYNSLMMLLYSMIQDETLKITSIEIYTGGRSRDTVKELQSLWEGKRRKYLDVVLKHLPIFEVGYNYRKEIKL